MKMIELRTVDKTHDKDPLHVLLTTAFSSAQLIISYLKERFSRS